MSNSDFCHLSFKDGVLGFNFLKLSEILNDLINRSISVTVWGSVRSVVSWLFLLQEKKYLDS